MVSFQRLSSYQFFFFAMIPLQLGAIDFVTLKISAIFGFVKNCGKFSDWPL